MYLFQLVDPVEHEWMLIAAKCDYQRMARMLQDHPELARRKVRALIFLFL